MVKRGFTIIELLVTIGIIGLLVATASVGLANARRASRDTTRLSDIYAIANGFEQAGSYNRRPYPDNVWNAASRNHLMCANEAAKSTDNNNIDLTVFKDRIIPSDPQPITRPPVALGTTPVTYGGCTSYVNGYTYHTHYNDNVDSLAYSHNGTVTEGYVFVLEVGLENERPADETGLVDREFFGLPTVSNRNVYYVLGRYCGEKCY